MGWSCSAKAAATLAIITNACVTATRVQNLSPCRQFFFERSDKGFADGGIGGRVVRRSNGALVGSWHINGQGHITKAPNWMKSLVPSNLIKE